MKIILCFLIFTLTQTGFAYTQDVKVFLDQVFSTSPEIKKSVEELKKADVETIQGKTGFLPELEASFTHFDDDEPTRGSEDPTRVTKLTLRQNLFSGFKDFYAIKYYNLNEEIAVNQVKAKKLTIADIAIDQFFQYTSLKKEIEHLNRQIEILNSRTKEQSQRSQIGKIRVAEYYGSAAESKLKQSEVQELNSKLKTQEALLIDLIGTIPKNVNYSEEVKIQSKDYYFGKLDSRPDLQTEKLKKEAIEKQVGQLDSEYYPNVNFSGNYYLDRPVARETSKWDFTVTVTLPLFSGFETYSKRSSKKQEAIAEEYQVQILRNQLRDQLEEKYNTLLQLNESYQILNEALDLAQKSYDLTRKDYNYGRVTNLDVLQSLRTYIETARSFDRSSANLYSAYYRLQIFVGDLP